MQFAAVTLRVAILAGPAALLSLGSALADPLQPGEFACSISSARALDADGQSAAIAGAPPSFKMTVKGGPATPVRPSDIDKKLNRPSYVDPEGESEPPPPAASYSLRATLDVKLFASGATAFASRDGANFSDAAGGVIEFFDDLSFLAYGPAPSAPRGVARYLGNCAKS